MAAHPEQDRAVCSRGARRLPFPFAKRHGVLIRRGRRSARTRSTAPAPPLRPRPRCGGFAGEPVNFVEVDAESFDSACRPPTRAAQR